MESISICPYAVSDIASTLTAHMLDVSPEEAPTWEFSHAMQALP